MAEGVVGISLWLEKEVSQCVMRLGVTVSVAKRGKIEQASRRVVGRKGVRSCECLDSTKKYN